MGNYKFRFSDMLPNAWLYKLKDMARFRTPHQHITKPVTHHHHHISKIPIQSDQRKSYYFTRELKDFHPTSPIFSTNIPQVSPRRSSCHRRRKSTKKTRPSHRLVPSSISATCNCQTISASEDPSENDVSPCLKSTKTISPMSQQNDPPAKTIPLMSQHDDSPDTPGLIIPTKTTTPTSLVSQQNDMPNSPGTVPAKTLSLLSHLSSDTMMSWSALSSCQCRNRTDISDSKTTSENNLELSLPPIITKKQGNVKNIKVSLDRKSPGRRFIKTSTSPGMKLRTKIANKRIQNGRKSVSSSLQRESLAVVKESEDPGKDFKESMVEMIVENNIRASEDLEDLLACYLLMNSDEYHGIIINVFKQIWFDIEHFRIK